MKKRIIPIFVPHRGCPHDCIFCNQKKITGVSTDITSEDVKNIVDEYLTTIDKDANVEIAFFGGSFTAIDVDIQKSLLSVAKEYVDKGLVNDIRMSTRPDCIDEDILKMLKEYKVSIIELGVQSLDEDVLRDSIRGHHAEEVFKSAKLIKDYGIQLGLQMMVGLPSDAERKCIETARKFIEMKPDCVRIYPTLVVKETGLENLLNERKIAELRKLLDQLEPIDIAILLNEFKNNDMILLFRILSKELAAETFVEMDTDAQETLIQTFSDNELKAVLG